MKKPALFCSAAVLVGLLLNQPAQGAVRTWNNMGTDYNTPGNWVEGVVPSGSNVALFNTAAIMQPNLSASISVAGLYFSGATSGGYDITSSGGAVFTLTGYGATGSGGTSNSSAAAIRSEITSGTNTVDASIILAPAGGSIISTFFQSTGGTLVVNGTISGSSPLSLKGASSGAAGTIQLNGNNSGFGGGVTINDAVTLVVGNDNALGTGTLTTSNSGAVIQAGGGTRTLSNSIVFGSDATVSGGNAFVINGSVTTSGANTRTVTVGNTGGTTFGGNVTIQGNTSPGTLVFNGSSAIQINGVVQDGAAGPGLLRYNGSSALTLNNTNTYSGGTQLTIAGATIIANHDGALGTGNVSLTASGVTLTLQNGLVNNYIADNAAISLVTGSTVNLNFGGTDIVNSFTIDGVAQTPGIHNATTDPLFLFGTGTLTVVPEPATYMLFGIGLLACAQRFRRRSKKA